MRRVFRLGLEDPLVGDFSCADADLDDYFKSNWKSYCTEMMATTYGVVEDGRLIAMFCVANDRLESEETGKATNRLLRIFPNPKRRHHFPSVKLARLGVSADLQGSRGIGSWILEFLKAYFVLNNKTGCRFLTVDSYPGRIPFYKKNGFEEFGIKDGVGPDDYVYMHYDLKITRDQYDRDPAKLAFAEDLIRTVFSADGFGGSLGAETSSQAA